MRRRSAIVLAALFAACGDEVRTPAPSAGVMDMGAARAPDAEAAASDAGLDAELDGGLALDAGAGGLDAGADDVRACSLGERCRPIVIDSSPFHDARDTAQSPPSTIDRYACAPNTNESGGEVFYAVEVRTRALFRASIDDRAGDAVDVDLHLLADLDPDRCLERDNTRIERVLDPGRYYLVLDTWADSNRGPLPGPYQLDVELRPLSEGRCAMDAVDLPTFWTDCAPGIDCYVTTDPVDMRMRPFLRTPAIGPVVLEAHLVTPADDFGGGWPTSGRDMIERHYTLSEAATGYRMARREPWAPSGEGGSRWGQGSTGDPVPVEAEAFYINMYWRHRPPAGTRMIVMNPENGRAVVTAAGYETGPGSNTAIAGVAEEVHDHLGTDHRDRLLVGFATDQTLPFGPVDCD